MLRQRDSTYAIYEWDASHVTFDYGETKMKQVST
jgi:hypothetical protein